MRLPRFVYSDDTYRFDSAATYRTWAVFGSIFQLFELYLLFLRR